MFEAFFRPQQVAVIGASGQPGKVGYDVLHNLLTQGYKGRIIPVNPKADAILGVPAVKQIKDLPQDLDLAVIAIKAHLVPEAVAELAAIGTKAVVVVSAGFKEVGGRGRELEAELRRVVRANPGLRLIGPNCVGIMDTAVSLNASFAGMMPRPGRLGFFSQSGAMGLAILDWSLDNNIGFSKFISLGNKADLTEVEVLELMAEDPDTKVILGYLEAVEDGRRFMEVARRVTRVKPVVLVKSGVTSAGARAASSHTGALAGADAAYDAAFRQCGVMRVRSMRELFGLALALAHQPLPAGPGLGILTNSGGPGIICADAAEGHGLHMGSLRPESADELREFLPAIASVYNPVDITGGAPAAMYRRSLEVMLADPGLDAAVVITTPTATLKAIDVAREICAVPAKKPVFAVIMGAHSVGEGRDECMRHGLPAYEFPEDAVAALKGMLDYRAWREAKPRTPELVAGDKAQVAEIIAAARRQGRVNLSETEARTCFAAYGVPVARSVAAATSEEAVAAARALGLPVVMKIDSPAISHKSDVGGVAVGLGSESAVAEAFHDMTGRIRRISPDAYIRGVLVQEMIRGGRETIVGFSRDPQFGPLLMFGLGGIYVEVLKDVSFRVAPIARADADEMVRGIRSFPLLRGVRGESPADLMALAGVLLALGSLAHDFPDLAEADINPLLVLPRGQGAMAVDARIALTPAKGEK
ncbi:MAG: acetate--CoA ligase family protein [Thermodesulfobacteriota bacterium]